MTATVKAIKEINDQKNTPGIIGDLEKKIKDLREQRSSETTVEGIKKLNAEIDKLQKQLDGLLGKSDSKADNKVKKLISAYVDELSKLKGLDFNFTNEIDDKTLKNQQEFIEKFKNNLERQGLKWDDKNREFAYYLSLQLKPASNEDKLMKEINIKGLADFNPWAGVSGLSGAYEDNAAALRKIAKEEAYLMNDIATSFGSTLASEGKKAFESIFGEANSLLEKFAMSIFDKFTGRIGNEISDMIFGAASGLGSTGSTTGILSTLLGFLGSSGAPTGGRTTINVMLDGETISEKVVTAQNVTRAIGKAQSMRLIN